MPSQVRTLIFASLIAIIALAVRFPFLNMMIHADVNLFDAWARRGIKDAYHPKPKPLAMMSDPDFICDYPPLPMLVFLWCRSFAETNTVGEIICLNNLGDPNLANKRFAWKLPTCYVDAVIAGYVCWIVTTRSQRRFPSSPLRAALIGNAAGLAAALAPALWFHTTCWGQIDSWYGLCMIATLDAATKRRWWLVPILLTLGLLIKIQMILMIPPLILMSWLDRLNRTENSASQSVSPNIDAHRRMDNGLLPWQKYAISIAGSLALASLAFAPFVDRDSSLLSSRQLNMFRHYRKAGVDRFPYVTVQAFNLHWMISDWRRCEPFDFMTFPKDDEGFGPLDRKNLSIAGLGLFMLMLAAFARTRLTSKSQPCDDVARELLYADLTFVWFASLFLLLTQMHERYILMAVMLQFLTLGTRVLPWIAFVLINAMATINMLLMFSPSVPYQGLTEAQYIWIGNVSACLLIFAIALHVWLILRGRSHAA